MVVVLRGPEQETDSPFVEAFFRNSVPSRPLQRLKTAESVKSSKSVTFFLPGNPSSTKARRKKRNVGQVSRKARVVRPGDSESEPSSSSFALTSKKKKRRSGKKKFSLKSNPNQAFPKVDFFSTKKGKQQHIGRRRQNNREHLIHHSEDLMASPPLSPGPLSAILYTVLLLLTLSCISLFTYSEWRLVRTRRILTPFITDYIPVSCEPKSRFNHHLIHIDCPLRNLETFYPPTEFSWNVDAFTGVFFEMKVEMYQWSLRRSGFGVDMGGKWADFRIGNMVSSKMMMATNPDYFPHVHGAGRKFASNVYAGGYRMNQKHLVNFRTKRQLTVHDDGYYSPPDERPPLFVDYSNTQAYDNALFTGDPLAPQVGDLRLTFWGSSATHVSALSMQIQHGGTFNLRPYPNRNAGNSTMELVYEGDLSPQDLFTAQLHKMEGTPWAVWTLRCTTLLLTLLFVFYSFRICDRKRNHEPPHVVLGSVLLALGILSSLAAPIWFLYSLLIGIGLLTLGFSCVIIAALLWTKFSPSSSNPQLNVQLSAYDTPSNRQYDESYNPNRNLLRAANSNSTGAFLGHGSSSPRRSSGQHFYQPV